MYYIYVIENLINGKMYIGQTSDPDVRKRRHLNGYETGCHALYNAVSKYGKESFDFNLLEQIETIEQANNQEKRWIEALGTMSPNGYNLRYGGDAGGKPSLETIEKIRQANLGRIQSEEEKSKRAASHRGRKNTSETIEKMRLAARNKSPEKYSMSGKKHSAETRYKMRISSIKSHCKRGHPLSGPVSDVFISKSGIRNCRICRRFRRSGTIWNRSNFSTAPQFQLPTSKMDWLLFLLQ